MVIVALVGIAALLYLVTVSDLAFGWNTTLSMDNDLVAGIFRWLAAPWPWVFPAAAPAILGARLSWVLTSSSAPSPTS